MFRNPAHRQHQHGNGTIEFWVGTPDGEWLAGGAGLDLIFGRGGADRLLGGRENDDLRGGTGADLLLGGSGMDHLDGGAGNDVLVGNAASDTLRGADGNDVLVEGVGHGDLEGGPGDDLLIGGPGGDAFVIAPGTGHDVVKDFAAGPGILDHLAVRDIAASELRFTDGEHGVIISWDGGASSVLLDGVFKRDLAQDDFMFTADRQVIRQTGLMSDRVTADVYARDEGEVEPPPGFDPETRAKLVSAFHEFVVKLGTGRADVFLGSEARDNLDGGAGNDRLDGAGGDDDLWGGKGDDLLVGGAGQDHLQGGLGRDRLWGGDQADSLMGDDGNDELFAGAGHDMLEGGRGNDRLDGGDGADAFIVAPDSGHDVVVGGFDAGPGAFDHIAFRDLRPEQVRLDERSMMGDQGVLVSWSTGPGSSARGSIFLVGIAIDDMAQDDLMFDADAAWTGAFENNLQLTTDGSQLIFVS